MQLATHQIHKGAGACALISRRRCSLLFFGTRFESLRALFWILFGLRLFSYATLFLFTWPLFFFFSLSPFLLKWNFVFSSFFWRLSLWVNPKRESSFGKEKEATKERKRDWFGAWRKLNFKRCVGARRTNKFELGARLSAALVYWQTVDLRQIHTTHTNTQNSPLNTETATKLFLSLSLSLASIHFRSLKFTHTRAL